MGYIVQYNKCGLSCEGSENKASVTGGRTDGWTDRITIPKTVQRIASHGKNCVTKFTQTDDFAIQTRTVTKLIIKVAKNQFAVSAIIVCVRILFLFTYAKMEYVTVGLRTYLSDKKYFRL